jgi:hypothetical protein
VFGVGWSAIGVFEVEVIPMKSRYASEWVKAYDHIYQELTAKGLKSELQTLDNEASAALKHFFTANDVEYQLVLPHCHRRNAKSHPNFQRTLCGRALLRRSNFPIAPVGQTFTPGGNHIKYLMDLETPSAAIRCGALSWPRGLQQNGVCSARVQNNCTRETGKETNLGTPRTP